MEPFILRRPIVQGTAWGISSGLCLLCVVRDANHEEWAERVKAEREEGEISDFVYDEEQDVFRFPEDGRFAFSREWADVKLLEERNHFG